jgi:hypothetical protein
MKACFFGLLMVLLVACTFSAPASADSAELAEVPSAPPRVTFYHWETELAPDATARHLLDSFACERLYVKAFDLSWRGQPKTAALVNMVDTVGLPQLIPVVFITNDVFANLPEKEVKQQAQEVIELVEELFQPNFPEVQIDCDWTARTQEQYFAFLKAVQALRPQLEVTCTVRLHQYRDRTTQGIPPVERATLMAYNTGDLNAWETENSIYDSTIVKAYLADQPPYPLKLDLGVAAYDWAAVYRREELAYLINEPNLTELADANRFRQLTDSRYTVIKSTYLEGIYLYRDDMIRLESVPQNSIDQQAALHNYYVKSFPGQRVMVFRLGSRGWR